MHSRVCSFDAVDHCLSGMIMPDHASDSILQVLLQPMNLYLVLIALCCTQPSLRVCVMGLMSGHNMLSSGAAGDRNAINTLLVAAEQHSM